MAPVDSCEIDIAADSEDLCELFECGICGDVLLEPVTIPCCGHAFCSDCLRQWMQTSVRSSGFPYCPAGCPKKILQFRLPATSVILQSAMEQLIPQRLEQRRDDVQEEKSKDDGKTILHCGFSDWQEVAAVVDIMFDTTGKIGVRRGTPGIVVDGSPDGRHVVVKFDQREDGSELCVHVLPQALVEPLPGGLRLDQRVVAVYELFVNAEVAVRLGTSGVVTSRHDKEHVVVQFDRRADNINAMVVVHINAIQAHKTLLGGFHIGQEIQAAADLQVGSQVVAKAGSRGIVINEYSDIRITVSLTSEAAGSRYLNVLPSEIVPWCEPPGDMPIDHDVESTTSATATTDES
jgi:hypothetical protein